MAEPVILSITRPDSETPEFFEKNLARALDGVRAVYGYEATRANSLAARIGVQVMVQRFGFPDGIPRFLCVTNRKRGKFTLPGGKVDPGETMIQAAAREFFEETGCHVFDLFDVGGCPLEEPADKDPDRTPWICYIFRGRLEAMCKPREVEPGTTPVWKTATEMCFDSTFPRSYQWLFHFIRHDASLHPGARR